MLGCGVAIGPRRLQEVLVTLSYRTPRIQNLGALFYPIIKAADKVSDDIQSISEDMRAFHAPSECGDIAYRNVYRPMEEAIRKLEQDTGMTWAEVRSELHERTGGRYLNWLSYSKMLPSSEWVVGAEW